ncbi:MAG: hypothetical protein HOV80_36890, partial [Polyangiaceae bacterium]|nr:hypothetical protein [Polyangiaceae bacterium]
MHQHGVAHGNVSPACVLLESNDPRRRGLVADVRRTAEMIQYHSPERFRDGQLTPGDDTWGVAATLFTAITAARPFGEVQQEILARLPHGVPALNAYRIQDDGLQAILSSALSPDPSRRIANVQHLRQHLERWFNDPSVFDLRPLDDEETGEEDQAATAMLAMDQMFDEPRSSQNDSGLFAPASFPQSGARPPGSAPMPSSPGMSSQQATERRPAPPAVPPAPLGEQDATVMRELPAHIMALAARAAGGSNPPPPVPPAPSSDEDTGGATRVGNTADIAAAMQAAREPPGPPVPLSQPGGPTSPRPRPPRAIRSTQLGVGMPMAPTPPTAPTPPAAPPGPAPPRPGFAPPPTSLSSAPPPNDPDEVRTMMHPTADVLKAMGRTAPNLPPGAPQPPPPPQRPPPPAPPQPPPQAVAAPPDAVDDDDDGGRTVLREPPSFDEFFRPPDAPNAPPAPQAQWKPAAPPMQPRAFGQGSTDRPPQGAAPGQPAAGVSALIQDTLDKGPAAGGPPPGFPPPMEPTSAFPGTQEWAGSQGGGGGEWQGQPAAGGGVAGPFAPLGAQPGPFAPQGAPGGPFGPQPFAPPPGGMGQPMHGGGPSDPMLQPGMDGMAQQQQPMDMGFGGQAGPP